MPLTLKEMRVLVKALNREFGYPFLARGEVRAKVLKIPSADLNPKYYINLQIARRDVDIMPDGDSGGAGTFLKGKVKVEGGKEK